MPSEPRPAPGADQLADLRAQLAEALAEMETATAELREQSATFLDEVEAERARLRGERARAEEEYADRARGGAAGEARQELQRRIDQEHTTWREVLSGADDHWSAREVRQELVSHARREIDVLETSDPELAVKYRAHASLRQDDPIGRWQ